MDKSARSLRRLPARSAKSAERSSSKGRTTKETDSPKPVSSPKAVRKSVKDSERREITIKSASPPRRRSRSRSNARKRAEALKNMKEVKKEVAIERTVTRSSTRTAPVASRIVSRLKDGIDHVRKSLSPEVDDIVRRSMSRFDEIATEVHSSVVTRRASSRLSNRASAGSVVINSVSGVSLEAAAIEEEDTREERSVVVTNHTGAKKEDKQTTPRESKNLLKYLKVSGLVLLGGAICSLILVSQAVCTKDDCRLLISNLPKVLNYSQYFDSYTWPAYTITLLLLIGGTGFTSRKQRRPSHFSIVGGIAAVLVLAAIWSCHQYYGGLRRLRIPPLVGASIFHSLILIAYAGSSSKLSTTVQAENLVQLSSSILTVLLNAWLCAVEAARSVPNPAVLVLGGLQTLVALDHLLLPPLTLGLGPIGLLWLALRPFLLFLPQVYLAANNIAVGLYALIGTGAVTLAGYIFYRYSSTVKNVFLRDPYSAGFSKATVCGDYNGGPWGLVRHPQLTGLLLCELSWAMTALPSLISAVLAPLSLVSTVTLSRIADRRLSRTYRAKVTSSLLPFVPY